MNIPQVFGVRRQNGAGIDGGSDPAPDFLTTGAPVRAQNLDAIKDSLDKLEAEVCARVEQQHKHTDLENIAGWVVSLTYTDMKLYAREVLGADATEEQVRELADKQADWASRKLGAQSS